MNLNRFISDSWTQKAFFSTQTFENTVLILFEKQKYILVDSFLTISVKTFFTCSIHSKENTVFILIEEKTKNIFY